MFLPCLWLCEKSSHLFFQNWHPAHTCEYFTANSNNLRSTRISRRILKVLTSSPPALAFCNILTRRVWPLQSELMCVFFTAWGSLGFQRSLKPTRALRNDWSSRPSFSSLSTLSPPSSILLSSGEGLSHCILSVSFCCCNVFNHSFITFKPLHYPPSRLVGRPGSYLYVFESYRMEEVSSACPEKRPLLQKNKKFCEGIFPFCVKALMTKQLRCE